MISKCWLRLLLIGFCGMLFGCGHVVDEPTTQTPAYVLSASIFADFMPEAISETADSFSRIRQITLQVERPFSVTSASPLVIVPVSCEIYVNGTLEETLTTFVNEGNTCVADGRFDYLASAGDIFDGSGKKISSTTVTVVFHCLINDVSQTFCTTPTLNIVH